MTELSTGSPIGFPPGEPSNSLDPVNPQEPLFVAPKAEEIEASKPLLPRILKVKSEDFFQWRQLLGTFQRNVRKSIQEGK
jgi:hypothetical protein